MFAPPRSDLTVHQVDRNRLDSFPWVAGCEGCEVYRSRYAPEDLIWRRAVFAHQEYVHDNYLTGRKP